MDLFFDRYTIDKQTKQAYLQKQFSFSTYVHFQRIVRYTVEPVYNGPVFSGHPLLSGQFS